MKKIFAIHFIILTILLHVLEGENFAFYASIYCLGVIHFFIYNISQSLKEILEKQNVDREIITKLNIRIKHLEKELYGETKDYITDSITGASDFDEENIGKN